MRTHQQKLRFLSLLLLLCLLMPVAVLAIPKLAYFEPGELSLVYQAFTATLGGGIPEILFYLFPCLIVNCVFSALTYYASISLGQLFA